MPKLRVLIMFSAVITAPALADSRLEYVDEKSGATQTVITVMDGNVRTDDASADAYTLYDRKTGTLTTVDTSEKTYTVLDRQTMEKVSGELSDAMKEMRKQMEQMPPEQRAMMEKMMGGAMNAGKSMLDVKIDRTGKTLQKGGYDCQQVFFSLGNLSRSELCVVPAEKIGLTKDDLATFNAMQEEMKAMAKRVSQGVGANLRFDMDSIGGLPVYTKQDTERTGEVLKGVTHENIDRSIFAVPDGYREEKIEFDDPS